MDSNPLKNEKGEEATQRPHRPDQLKKDNLQWELRSVVGVFRHGDRTPKQKMKMKTSNPIFLKFFANAKNPKKEVKLKTPAQLQKLLDITKKLLDQI